MDEVISPKLKLMQVKNLTLLVPEKSDIERDAVAKVWEQNFGPVLRLGRFWDPPQLDAERVRVYGSDSFCQVLAQKLQFSLISPEDDLILKTPKEYLQRNMWSVRLGDVDELSYPVFVKPLQPKLFNASIVYERAQLVQLCLGLEFETALLVSDIFEVLSEARFFILDQEIFSCSIFEGDGDLEDARNFVSSLLANFELPRTVVVDVGCAGNKEWRIVEYNATWGSGLNGCDAADVIHCLAAATLPGDA